MRLVRLVTMIAVLIATSPALARDVYLNKVKLDPNVIVKNQTFEGCAVRFDEHGDVWITVKGLDIAVAPTGGARAAAEETPAPAGDRVTKHYFLVAPQTNQGKVQYDVDVFMNGRFVRKIRAADPRLALEVTGHVRPGKNSVRFVATKNVGSKRLSSSPSDVMEIMIGEGAVGGGTVVIDRTAATYRRNAAETGNSIEELTFTAR